MKVNKVNKARTIPPYSESLTSFDTIGSDESGYLKFDNDGNPFIDTSSVADGLSVLSGHGAPSGSLGAFEEFYIDIDTWNIYGPKGVSSWGAGTSLIGPQGNPGPEGSLPLALEMKLAFKAANLTNYKILSYVDSILSEIDIWETQAQLTKLFNKVLTYNINGQLSQIILTRISDSTVLTKDFVYNLDGSLNSITSS